MNEIYEALVEAKIDSRALTILVDTILDNCYIDYKGELAIDRDADGAILAVVKAFRAEEYCNRYNELKSKEEA
jgi:hypothetical protein